MAKLSTYIIQLRSAITHVAPNNVLTFPYNPGDVQADFVGGGALLLVNGGRLALREDTDTFTIAFNAGDITLTWHDLLHSVGDVDDISITMDLFNPLTGGGDVPASRTINTTAPLQGGGDLSADRTISIAANGITNSLLRPSVGLSVIGRNPNTTGDVADITASADGDVLRRAGTVLSFGKISNLSLTANTIIDSALRQGAAASVIGRSANSIGNVADIAAGGDGQFLSRHGGTLAFAAIVAADLPAATETAIGAVELLTDAETATGTDTTRAATAANIASAYRGRFEWWIGAASLIPRVTNGPGRGFTELTTNKNNLETLDFDPTTQEFAQIKKRMPKSWNEGTFTFIPIWTAASGSGGVVFALQIVAVSNDDAMDVAFGTEQTSTDTLITANDEHEGPESAAITAAGTPATGDLVMFQIKRNPADGSDTLAVDAKLLGFVLVLTFDRGNDA